VLGYRSTPACPRLLRHRTVWLAGVMGDSSPLSPLLLGDSERRGGTRHFPESHRSVAWRPSGSGSGGHSAVPSARYPYRQPEIAHLPFRRPSTISADIVASPQAKGYR